MLRSLHVWDFVELEPYTIFGFHNYLPWLWLLMRVNDYVFLPFTLVSLFFWTFLVFVNKTVWLSITNIYQNINQKSWLISYLLHFSDKWTNESKSRKKIKDSLGSKLEEITAKMPSGRSVGHLNTFNPHSEGDRTWSWCSSLLFPFSVPSSAKDIRSSVNLLWEYCQHIDFPNALEIFLNLIKKN